MVNIVPADDWINHEESTCCICGPEIKYIEGEMLVVHYAVDAIENEDIARSWKILMNGKYYDSLFDIDR